MHRPPHSVRRAAGLLVSSVVLLAASACGGGGDTVAVESTTSTTDDAAVAPGGFPDDYCERAEQLSSTGALRLDVDPGRAAAAMETLAADAPRELVDDFDVVNGQVGRLGDPGGDPSSALELIDLLLDPDFLAALDRVERATLEQCGVRLGAAGDDTDAEPVP